MPARKRKGTYAMECTIFCASFLSFSLQVLRLSLTGKNIRDSYFPMCLSISQQTHQSPFMYVDKLSFTQPKPQLIGIFNLHYSQSTEVTYNIIPQISIIQKCLDPSTLLCAASPGFLPVSHCITYLIMDIKTHDVHPPT